MKLDTREAQIHELSVAPPEMQYAWLFCVEIGMLDASMR